jgi:hypothetical protein
MAMMEADEIDESMKMAMMVGEEKEVMVQLRLFYLGSVTTGVGIPTFGWYTDRYG